MKIDRLIGILTILLQKDKVTAPQLADMFEVSVRTINRDIDDLTLAGIPLITTRGVNGGIQIMDGYRMDKTLLTNHDMQAILTGLRSLDSISKTNRYAQLMEKLSAGNSSVLTADEHILINLAAWNKQAVSSRLEIIHHAIEKAHILHFQYVSPKGETLRTIEPYYLIFEWNNWYVWGWCIDKKDYRLFKLRRMTEIQTGNSFSKRKVPYPDLSNDRIFPVRYHVKAIIQPQYKWRILEEYGPDSFVVQEDGNLLFAYGFTDSESIRSWVLSFGEGIELLEPEDFREELKTFGENLINKYAKHDI